MNDDLFDEYATDETLELDGAWVEIGKGRELLIARSGNRAYAKLLQKTVDKASKVLDMGDDVADAKSDEIMVEVIATTILRGWRTKVDKAYVPTVNFKGEAVTYSVAQAKKMVAVKDFRRLVMKHAEDMEAYKLKKETEQGEA